MEAAKLLLEGNGSLFCLAKWQTEHGNKEFETLQWSILLIKFVVFIEGCPSRACQDWTVLQDVLQTDWCKIEDEKSGCCSKK